MLLIKEMTGVQFFIDAQTLSTYALGKVQSKNYSVFFLVILPLSGRVHGTQGTCSEEVPVSFCFLFQKVVQPPAIIFDEKIGFP